MTFKKGLAAIILATAALAACGSEKEEETVEEQVVEEIDLSSEAEQFRAFAVDQMEAFITDAEMLAGYIKEGKLEEAQKLYPLVRMYYERLQPMKEDFAELDAQIDAQVAAGKEENATGFRRLEYGLFDQKTTSGYEAVADELVANIRKLGEELPTMELDGQRLLDGTEEMLAQVTGRQLTGAEINYAGSHVYDVKANAEAVEQIVKIFMSRADAEQAADVTEKLAGLNDALAYYEVGKEDYINYSYFTNKQKQELIDMVSDVHEALKEMNESIQ